MTIFIIREQATPEQLHQMRAAFDGALIKLAVDAKRKILAGGGGLHADCEQVLLDDGSLQVDIWGADWYPDLKRVGFESLINIRPRQQNFHLEIQEPELKMEIEMIVRSRLEVN